MSFIEEILPSSNFLDIRNKMWAFAESSFLQSLSNSMSNTSCNAGLEGCRDEPTALILKYVAISAILIAGICGVGIPFLGKKWRFLGTDSNLLFVAKAFAGGVILATGFVHMLPDATSSLTDSCLPEIPWSKFPFSCFIAMMAALGTLLVEFVGTQYYECKQQKQSGLVQADSPDFPTEEGIDQEESRNLKGEVFGEEVGGAMHIVGIHAHAAHHRHSHPHEQGSCDGSLMGHAHSHSNTAENDGDNRHVIVSQVLELGIVSHSVIIGLSLGVSQSPCTIRPLIGALSFHQFFEGFALGGCILQAKFKTLRATMMACFFAITTPIGIAVGIGISSIYNPKSPRALIVEGILDSVSAGILVYMALVDLVAANFLSKRMSCNVRLQVISYIALFLGAGLMSLLALWA